MAFSFKKPDSPASPEAAMAINPAAAKNVSAKRKQITLLGGLGAVLVLAGSFYVSGRGDKAKPVVEGGGMQPVFDMKGSVNRNFTEQEWILRSESELSDVQGRLKLVEKGQNQTASLRDEVSALKQENARMLADAKRVVEVYERENAQLKRAAGQGGGARREPAAARGTGPMGPDAAPWQGQEPFRVAGTQGSPGAAGPAGRTAPVPMAGPAEVKTISFAPAAGKDSAAAGEGMGFRASSPVAPSTAIEASPDYLPPNSYAPAKVIVGVDASVGVSSQTDPLPVLLRITGPARSVVNNGRLLTTKLEGCVINGAARGDLSAEKVYVKLVRMTCDQPGGRVAVSEVKGFISFAGKTGVRGRVVSREGSLVGKAFLAGIASGFGRGFSANTDAALRGNQTIVNGERQNLSPTDILTGGFGQGVSTSADMVSRYLIERAEQYQPIVEMPTGIDVEIVFLEGVYVRGTG